jgi:1-acyl-sn-glycerol-3-phosphate acyltransferase
MQEKKPESQLKDKRRHPKGFFYVFKRITKIFIDLGIRQVFIRGVSLAFYLYFKIRNNLKVYGRENLPKSGPYLLVGNHSSVADALLLIAVFCGIEGKIFKYIAHAKDFKRDDSQRYFHMLFGGKPRRGKGEDLVKYMAQELLKGNVVAIPPEGMYNKDNKIMKGYTGTARIYHLANKYAKQPIPIVPLVSIGAGLAYPTELGPNGKFQYHKIGIIGRYGKPFYLPKTETLTHEILQHQTDFIMEKIANLALQKEGPVDSWILAEKNRNVKRTY